MFDSKDFKYFQHFCPTLSLISHWWWTRFQFDSVTTGFYSSQSFVLSKSKINIYACQHSTSLPANEFVPQGQKEVVMQPLLYCFVKFQLTFWKLWLSYYEHLLNIVIVVQSFKWSFEHCDCRVRNRYVETCVRSRRNYGRIVIEFHSSVEIAAGFGKDISKNILWTFHSKIEICLQARKPRSYATKLWLDYSQGWGVDLLA